MLDSHPLAPTARRTALVFALVLALLSFLDARGQGEEDGRDSPGQPLVAPGQPLVEGQRHRVASKVFGGERELHVRLPVGYTSSACEYPVVFVMDGDLHSQVVAGIARSLAWADKMPSVIVVGVSSQTRGRELTPPSEAGRGEGDRTLRFLLDEAVPFIEEHYRAARFRVLFGHSLGGLFATYAMLTESDGFQAVIASSPSLYWEEGLLVRRFAEEFADMEARAFYFASAGDRGERGDIRAAVEELRRHMEASEPPELGWEARTLVGADHFSSVPHAVLGAFETLFTGWGAYPLARRGDYDRLVSHYEQLQGRFGYPVAIPEAMLNSTVYALLRAGHHEGALTGAERNVRAYPGSPNAHDTHGDMLEKAGRIEAAVAAYERACRLAKQSRDPREAVFQEHLEQAREKLE